MHSAEILRCAQDDRQENSKGIPWPILNGHRILGAFPNHVRVGVDVFRTVAR
jgi:hypothetical protein